MDPKIIHFLSEYLTLAHIPRGLRIKKFPTSELFDDQLKKEWTDTLDTCSFKLMDILISSKKKELEVLQTDMSLVQKDLTILQTHTGFSELDGRLNRRLDKMEKSVIDSKKGKMARDKNDYESNKVYTWKKPQFNLNRSWRNQGKQVRFSDQESIPANDTSAYTTSDSSFERSAEFMEPTRAGGKSHAGNPHRSGHSKKKKTSTKKLGEAAGNTKTTNDTHYSLRGRVKK